MKAVAHQSNAFHPTFVVSTADQRIAVIEHSSNNLNAAPNLVRTLAPAEVGDSGHIR